MRDVFDTFKVPGHGAKCKNVRPKQHPDRSFAIIKESMSMCKMSLCTFSLYHNWVLKMLISIVALSVSKYNNFKLAERDFLLIFRGRELWEQSFKTNSLKPDNRIFCCIIFFFI